KLHAAVRTHQETYFCNLSRRRRVERLSADLPFLRHRASSSHGPHSSLAETARTSVACDYIVDGRYHGRQFRRTLQNLVELGLLLLGRHPAKNCRQQNLPPLTW